jgi:feruloyl esterase
MGLSALVGRALTAQFYNQSEDFKAYHMGCGDGGRQGFRAAQAHPDLFDGIIAGAPAINTDMLAIWYANAFKQLGRDESSHTFLLEHDWGLITDEVLRQCDTLDGAEDGILEDTRACDLNINHLYCFSVERCRGGLTYLQVFAMEMTFKLMKIGSVFAHAGAAHGNEMEFANVFYSSAAQNAAKEWYRYVFPGDNPGWELEDYELEDGLETLRVNPGDIHTYDPDLSAFRDRGGKILHWHGQADAHISVSNSDYYYDLVLNATSPNATDTSALDDWYRYFRLSGTDHCGGGPGANFIGQRAQPGADEKTHDNILLAMVAWVEKGVAPETLRGVKWKGDDPKNGINFSRKHCKHPRVNQYNGTANGKNEDGWTCVDK